MAATVLGKKDRRGKIKREEMRKREERQSSTELPRLPWR